MMILTNALGISDSGGITVLVKYLEELTSENIYSLICYNENSLTQTAIEQFKNNEKFTFISFEKKSFFHRLCVEHFEFRKLIKKFNVDLIYNLSGSAQFLSIIQIIKLQNLMFYSKALDNYYKKNFLFFLWLKQILIKRAVFLQLYNSKKYFEIQSSHVKSYFLDYTKSKDRYFYIKSDIKVTPDEFSPIKQYAFTTQVSFLYIIGPHFEIPHKNFKVFVDAMLLLKRNNINFKIVITLTSQQLNSSKYWDKNLNSITTFLGYASQDTLKFYFSNNTILVSTSIIETLGLHVVEAIKNGCLAIVPNEFYSSCVYGKSILQFNTISPESMLRLIYKILQMNNDEIFLTISKNQDELKKSEKSKMTSINEIFKDVLKIENKK